MDKTLFNTPKTAEQTAADDALWSYAIGYKALNEPFFTSWSTYSFFETEPERLVSECILADGMEKEAPTYQNYLPHKLIQMAEQKRPSDDEMDSIGDMIKAMMIDLIECYIREAE